ncbi:MAG: undecaprenyl-diphosphatase UppP [Patescibacteria group bacterium]|nr:undecaprenyl-diphosphatase UppP [Patescibacteria group bacterium]
MISGFSALLLGIVEGFTEFLPISSTAHLILVSDILGIVQSDFTKTFEIAIQSGAIAAVIVLFWRELCNRALLKKIIIAFIPTGVLGLIFYKIVKTYLIGNTEVVLWALAIGGVLLIVFERFFAGRKTVENINDISYRAAVGIGFFQAIAMIPGVSRAAATIVGGMILGVRREAIVEFSFLLAVPTMLAATGFDLVKNIHTFSFSDMHILTIGSVVSFVTAIISIRFLLEYIRKHSLAVFGVYRIALVVLFLIIIR